MMTFLHRVMYQNRKFLYMARNFLSWKLRWLREEACFLTILCLKYHMKTKTQIVFIRKALEWDLYNFCWKTEFGWWTFLFIFWCQIPRWKIMSAEHNFNRCKKLISVCFQKTWKPFYPLLKYHECDMHQRYYSLWLKKLIIFFWMRPQCTNSNSNHDIVLRFRIKASFGETSFLFFSVLKK